MELLAFIVFATQEGNGWGGEVVFYVTDNQNVQTWLAKRRPKVRAARRLILLLHRLEVENCFRCVPVYIRTYGSAGWLVGINLPGERGATAQLARQLTAHGTWTSLPKRIWIQYRGKSCSTAPRSHHQHCRLWSGADTLLLVPVRICQRSHRTREELSSLEP